ncbi:hypothetical protein CWATWH0402_4350 [Crocosphaera watsonii WH 0402]|uniref:Uncharacterized protein n=1 Tax=Crocosphaera watsonii WH 0402 TaxID=1284629 RepID=T2JJ44_CROWT|nr:hypothetical protein CWATWH0402_4350 [Crocosphaera watsonii WH 0402]
MIDGDENYKWNKNSITVRLVFKAYFSNVSSFRVVQGGNSCV